MIIIIGVRTRVSFKKCKVQTVITDKDQSHLPLELQLNIQTVTEIPWKMLLFCQ